MLMKTPVELTYLSAQELGITEEERAALLWVREELASGRIEHRSLLSDWSEPGFNMASFGQGCGTVACIGGWMSLHMNKPSQRFYVGSEKEMRPLTLLFYPSKSNGPIHGYSILTPAQAVRAIDFWATGNQQNCWALALSEA